jgi:hypothetical protein
LPRVNACDILLSISEAPYKERLQTNEKKTAGQQTLLKKSGASAATGVKAGHFVSEHLNK